MEKKKAIIIGATSGIGEELSRQLSAAGYEVGLTGRREERLAAIAETLPEKSCQRKMDVAEPDAARQIFREMLSEMGDVDLVVINAGIGTRRRQEWEIEKQLLDINVTGFVAIAKAALDYFSERKRGHIVGVSSVAGTKGLGAAMAYSSSKAFISTYMQGMRQYCRQQKLDITVTDIRPGFVKTPMTESRKGMFWVATVEKAVAQMVRAINKRRGIVYVTRRWRWPVWFLKMVPDWLFIRMG